MTTDLRIAKNASLLEETYAMINAVSQTHLILDMFHKSLKRGKLNEVAVCEDPTSHFLLSVKISVVLGTLGFL